MSPTDGLGCARISVTFDATPVLDGVDLRVARGTTTALVGPSGVGKTTLLRVVAGLTAPDAGRVEVDGRDVTGVRAHERPVGMIFQQARLFPHLAVLKNVCFPLRARRIRAPLREDRALSALEEVGAAHLRDRGVADLSGGEQQRVALARALVADPRVLLLDEPLAAVDPPGRADLRRTVRSVLAARGITALFVTHDPREAAEVGDRVAVITNGRIAQDDTPRAVFDRPVSLDVARLVGQADLLRLVVVGRHAELDGARIPVAAADGPVTVAVRPENVALDPAGPLRGRVVEVIDAGTHARVRLALGTHVVHAHVHADAVPAPGNDVRVAIRDCWPLPDEAGA